MCYRFVEKKISLLKNYVNTVETKNKNQNEPEQIQDDRIGSL